MALTTTSLGSSSRPLMSCIVFTGGGGFKVNVSLATLSGVSTALAIAFWRATLMSYQYLPAAQLVHPKSLGVKVGLLAVPILLIFIALVTALALPP